MGGEFGADGCFTDVSGELVDLFAVLVEADVGDALDAFAAGDFLGVIDVDFSEPCDAGMFLGYVFEDGSELFAGATPFGVEVDDDESAGLCDEGVEFGSGEVADGGAACGGGLGGGLGGGGGFFRFFCGFGNGVADFVAVWGEEEDGQEEE